MSTIKTGTTTTTGLIVEADTSGNLVVQTGSTPTTALTISGTNQQITPAAPISMVGGYSFRNKIINGNFDIWQRATSQTSSGYGSADRWNCGNSGSTKTASQQAFALGQTDVPNNPKYFMRHVVTSVAGAANFVAMWQKIEGVETLSGQTATLSFWAKADSAKNIAIEFFQSFGTGGSPSSSVDGIDAQLVALTTSWTKYTVTVNIPSVSGKTLGTNGDDWVGITFWFDAGSNYDARAASLGQQSGTFDIAQVQIEEGSAATPFEIRPIGAEISLCERYYETGTMTYSTYNSGGTNSYTSRPFRTTKRASPTVSVTAGSGIVNGGWILQTATSTDLILQDNTSTTGIIRALGMIYTADAEL